MTEQVLTRWTCDRCGHVHEQDGDNEPPDWIRLAYALPARSAINGTRKLADLCPTCWTATQEYIRTDHPKADEQDTAT